MKNWLYSICGSIKSIAKIIILGSEKEWILKTLAIVNSILKWFISQSSRLQVIETDSCLFKLRKKREIKKLERFSGKSQKLEYKAQKIKKKKNRTKPKDSGEQDYCQGYSAYTIWSDHICLAASTRLHYSCPRTWDSCHSTILLLFIHHLSNVTVLF